MARAKSPPNAAVAAGVILMLVTFAVLLIVRYTYDGPGLGKTWPGLIIGVGICFAIGGLLEMGLGIIALFSVWLASNLDYITFSKVWPFVVLLVAVLVAVGYIRARAASDKES